MKTKKRKKHRYEIWIAEDLAEHYDRIRVFDLEELTAKWDALHYSDEFVPKPLNLAKCCWMGVRFKFNSLKELRSSMRLYDGSRIIATCVYKGDHP